MTVTIKKVKHYEILEPIGEGGMGEVYLALDTILDRKVAIKFLPEETQHDHTSRERFIREAKSAASLDHPFICKIYEAGEVEGKAYIVMEFLEGEDLGEKLKKDTLPLRNSLNIALEIAEALEKAHKNNIVHRDLKPANIMLTPQGHVKVMDFGLAKRVLPGGEEAITRTVTQASITERGTIAGTISYMSPEQARGDEVDQRSDIFALGIILQEMLTGDHPFSKTSAIETLSSILRDPAPPTNIKPKAVNPVLTPILKKSLAKDLNDRYPNTTEFADDIRKAQKELTGGAPTLRRFIPIIGAGIVITALLVFIVLRFLRQPITPETEAPLEAISVIIADAQNQTGDPVFNGVLEKLLSISLDSTSYVSVYDSKQARQQAIQIKPSSEGKLDLELAQLISRRQGINAVIDTSIESSNGGYIIRVSAWDPASTDKIAEVNQSIKSKADVLKITDILSAKLSAELGVIPADSTEALLKETFTTTSLEAMNAYAKAQELDDLGKPDEAIQWFQRALDYDPNFGRAYAILAVISYNRGQYQEARNYFQEAMKRIDQMTDREKYRTRGIYYLMIRNFKKAIEEYSALLVQFPGDYAAHANLALAYFFARNMPKAVEEGRLDIEYNPQSINGRYNLSWYALGDGDFPSAEAETRKVLEIRPEFAEAYVTLALSQLAQDRIVEATETYHKLKTVDSFGTSVAGTGLADLAIYEGRLKDSITIIEKGIEFDLENELTYNAADKCIMLALVLLNQGKHGQAIKAIERACETNRNDDVLFSAARIYLEAGQTEKVRTLAGELNKKIEPEPLVYAKLIGGEMSIARGDMANAISLFQEAQEILDTWLGRFLLGRAYLEAKAYTEAYSEFELCIKRRGEAASVFLNDLPSSRYLPPVYYYLGRAQEGLGSDAASESFQKFLKIKENADGDWMVDDARKRLGTEY